MLSKATSNKRLQRDASIASLSSIFLKLRLNAARSARLNRSVGPLRITRELKRMSRGGAKPHRGLNMKASHLVLLFVFLLTGCGGQSQPPIGHTPSQAQESPKPDARFRCEGKTRCSQMSSCEEATFYIQNCPGTEMDGDGDGVPCESQWCRH